MKSSYITIFVIMIFVSTLLSAFVSASCIDSDNGRNYSMQGFVNYSSNSYSYCMFLDSCYNTNVLKEYYCYNNTVRYIYNNCGTAGCNSGRCGSTVCVPKTCSQLGKQCGTWNNGCTANLNCGTCTTGQACNTAGQCTSNASSTYYGVGIGADSLNNHQVADMDVDFRFRASTTSAIQSLIWYDVNIIRSCPPISGSTYGCGNGGRMHICIQTDDGTANHLSTGVNLACTDDISPMASFFPSETFSSSAVLSKGQLYHIHWHNIDANPTQNFVSVNSEFVWDATVPRQPTIPDTDLAVFRGTTLQTHDTPIFQIHYTDGTIQGQGYMENWVGTTPVISGARQVREQFIVSGGDKIVKSVSLRLGRDSASGISPLTVRLETASGVLIEQGTISYNTFPLSTSSDNANNHNAWGTYIFTTPRTLISGQGYHLVLTASSDTIYHAQPIRRGPGYGFTPPTFFGDGYGQYSIDSGATWSGFNQPGGTTNRQDADLQFFFK